MSYKKIYEILNNHKPKIYIKVNGRKAKFIRSEYGRAIFIYLDTEQYGSCPESIVKWGV